MVGSDSHNEKLKANETEKERSWTFSVFALAFLASRIAWEA